MADTDKIAVLLAPGFEEIEAVTPVDVFRRAQRSVNIVAVEGGENVQGSRGVVYGADCKLSDISEADLDLVILPGGMPGSENLAGSQDVVNLVQAMADKGKLVSAICAAPIALEAAGLIRGKRVTAYPAVKDRLTSAEYTGNRVEVDGRIITGIGPGAALEFSYELLRQLGDPEMATELAEGMCALDSGK